MESINLAKLFHELYEKYAPSYGYETRPETRSFNKNSKNGQLMIAVCTEILNRSPIAQQTLPCSETASGQSPKLPDLDKCYQDIPFPEDEKECAFFVAGISELHKYLTCKC